MRRDLYETRFWSKADMSGDCWEWLGVKKADGYPTSGGALAHRIAWNLLNGPIPSGLALDHTCHNRGCINPAHMRLVTRKQNQENRTGARAGSRSGVRGVTWSKSKKRWQARVGHNGKVHCAGYFIDLPSAEAAAVAKRNELFTHNDADRMGDAA